MTYWSKRWVAAALFAAALALPRFAGGDQWEEATPLPEPRWFLRARVADGRVLAFGGWIDREGPRSKTKGVGRDGLLTYEPSSAKWIAGPPAPRFEFYSERLRTSRKGGEKKVFWQRSSRPGMHEPHLEGPVAAVDQSGRLFWFSKLGPVIYDSASNVWTQAARPVRRRQPENRLVSGALPHEERINAVAATGPDGRIYLLGGAGHALDERDEDKRLVLLRSLEVYDPAANTYTMKAPMKQGRQIFAAEFGPDGKLYAFGGYGTVPYVKSREGESEEEYARRQAEMIRLGRRALDSVEAYDPTTDIWTERRRLPRPVMSGDAARCPDERIYLVGGEPALHDTRAVREVWIYDARRDSWSKGPSLGTPRHGHGLACTPDGKLYAIGGTNAYTVPTLGSLLGGEGRDKGGPLASVEVLDTTKLDHDD